MIGAILATLLVGFAPSSAPVATDVAVAHSHARGAASVLLRPQPSAEPEARRGPGE